MRSLPVIVSDHNTMPSSPDCGVPVQDFYPFVVVFLRRCHSYNQLSRGCIHLAWRMLFYPHLLLTHMPDDMPVIVVCHLHAVPPNCCAMRHAWLGATPPGVLVLATTITAAATTAGGATARSTTARKTPTCTTLRPCHCRRGFKHQSYMNAAGCRDCTCERCKRVSKKECSKGCIKTAIRGGYNLDSYELQKKGSDPLFVGWKPAESLFRIVCSLPSSVFPIACFAHRLTGS